MKRRFPLWLTLLPLIAAVAGYWFYWSGQRDAFRAELARALPGSNATIGGFPYRLEATVAAPLRRSRAPDIDAQVSASRAVLNRGPFQRELTVIRTTDPRVAANIPALAGSRLTIAARAAQSSLNLDKTGAIARLSTIFETPRIDLALLGGTVTANRFEAHIREIPGRLPEPWSPTLPERAQIVLSGDAVRLGTGTPLRFSADLKLTGPTRLINYANWAGKGTVEIRSLTLSDTTGEVLRLNATLAAAAARPRLAGTIVTVCPRTVQAALTLAPRVSEQRLRIPVKLALGGTPDAWTLTGLPATPRPVRAQLPACPALR